MPVGGDLKYIDFSVVPPQMTTPGDLKSGDFFPDQHPPPDGVDKCATPPRKFSFQSGPLLPPPPPFTKQFCGKNVDLSVRDFNWLNTYPIKLSLAYIGVTKKKLFPFCLQRTMCITQENEARDRNTSTRSLMILDVLEHMEL